jgi:hypothetical protein
LKKIAIFLIFILFALNTCNTDNSNENNETVTQHDSLTKIDSVSSEKGEILKDTILVVPKEIDLSKNNEKIVFAFKTEKGKSMNLVMDKDRKYMAYRFGTSGKIELQFPEKLENTFEQFTYNYYMRGGGASNEGIDLNYISFAGDTHRFIIFEEWSYNGPNTDDQTLSVGIRIIDLKTKKETIIKGISSTAKGSLIDFRFNDLVNVEMGEI